MQVDLRKVKNYLLGQYHNSSIWRFKWLFWLLDTFKFDRSSTSCKVLTGRIVFRTETKDIKPASQTQNMYAPTNITVTTVTQFEKVIGMDATPLIINAFATRS